MGDEEQEYFATVGSTSDVGRHAEYTSELPSDPEALGEVVRSLMIHNGSRPPASSGPRPRREREGSTVPGRAARICS